MRQIVKASLYISLFAVFASLIWCLIAGLNGFSLYSLLLFSAIAIIMNLVLKKTDPNRFFKARLRSQEKRAERWANASRKISIIGVGKEGFILLDKYQKSSPPNASCAKLIFLSDDAFIHSKTQFDFDDNILVGKGSKNADNIISLSKSREKGPREVVKDSDLVFIIADMIDDLSNADFVESLVMLCQAVGSSVYLLLNDTRLIDQENDVPENSVLLEKLRRLQLSNFVIYSVAAETNSSFESEIAEQYSAYEAKREEFKERLVTKLRKETERAQAT